MLGLTNDGIGAPEYCCGGMGWEPGGRFTFGRDCISERVGSSCAPEEGVFRGVVWEAELLEVGGVPKVEFH
jgi:hypothetical protein